MVARGFAGGQKDLRIGDGKSDGGSLECLASGGAVMAKTQEERRCFQAVLKRGDRALGWTVARLPFVPAEVWQGMVRLRVAGTINGWQFRTSLFPDEVGFYLLVNRAMQLGGGVALGAQAEFCLWPDRDERPAELPDALAALLDEEDGLRAWYDELSESMRREIGKWVLGVKREETQVRRAMQMAERLMASMEAERELPPLIARALAANGRACAGWQQMTTGQRRRELMGVFYYQTPEARERRVVKLVEAAEQKAV